ncbi:MAG: FAD-dependent oxidoreductase, partial [Planctomycetes bacterium]|nr:FAD-dependent oxidoreductase [Planctomycetota bacterium]
MTSVAVVGGGAAGMMAALFAARDGAEVTLLEGSKDCGRKVLVSGGGRCNVLPSTADADDFHTSGSRNVLKRLLRTWRLPEQRAFFEQELGIPLVEEEDSGKLFPASDRARDVRDGLLQAARAAGAELRLPWRGGGQGRPGGGGLPPPGRSRGERRG